MTDRRNGNHAERAPHQFVTPTRQNNNNNSATQRMYRKLSLPQQFTFQLDFQCFRIAPAIEFFRSAAAVHSFSSSPFSPYKSRPRGNRFPRPLLPSFERIPRADCTRVQLNSRRQAPADDGGSFFVVVAKVEAMFMQAITRFPGEFNFARLRFPRRIT